MLRNIKLLFLTLLFTSAAFGQSLPIRNDSNANLRDLGSDLNVGRNFSVDQQGRIKVVVSSTSAGIYVEDTAHVTADPGQFVLGVANPSRASLAADGDYIPFATTVHGALMVSLDATAVTSAGNQPVRLEDAAFATSDATMVMGAVNARSFAAYNSTNGDVTPISVGDKGVVLTMPMYDSSMAGGSSSLMLEGASVVDQDALFRIGAAVKTSFGAGTSNGTYGVFNADLDGRLAVNASGSAPNEYFSSCGTATATTSDVSMKGAAGVGVRNYISTITCKNTSATVATSLDFKDGSTAMAAGGISQMATTSPGSFVANFNPPIRGTANTAFNFATNISVSSVTCCAQGFTSSN